MNEAEFAQILAEAMRQKSYEIKTGAGLHPFKNLLEGKEAIVSVHLSGDGQLTFESPKPDVAPRVGIMDIVEIPMYKNESAEEYVARTMSKPQTEETIKPKRRERTTTSEDSYSKRT